MGGCASGDELTRRLRTTQESIQLYSDPMQAMAPVAGVVLPQVLGNESTEAQLFHGGPVQKDGRLFQMTTFSIESPGEVQIELASQDFSPFLVATQIGHGTPLEAAGQVGRPAIIRMTPSSNSFLLIMCTSVEPDRVGSFTFRVEHTR